MRVKRVLIIDCDPQSSMSIVLGLDPGQLRALDNQGKTLYFGLVKETPLTDLIIPGKPDLIPSSIRLANAENEMISVFGTATILKEKLATLKDRYDVILIDCPPTLSMLTVNALTAADAVVVPTKCDYLSIMGIPLLLDTIENVRRRANPNLRIIGIIPTMFNSRASHDNDALAELRSIGSAKHLDVFEPVNRSTMYDKANVEGKAALELFPHAPGVEQYRLVAQRILHYAS
jgi:chromosome partitioning protein